MVVNMEMVCDVIVSVCLVVTNNSCVL